MGAFRHEPKKPTVLGSLQSLLEGFLAEGLAFRVYGRTRVLFAGEALAVLNFMV